jgi:hypothetical protein
VKDAAENRRRLLEVLEKSVDPKTGRRIPLNKWQLQRKAGIRGRQTILNLVWWLQGSGWLDVSKQEARKNRYTRYYALNDYGALMSKTVHILEGAKKNQTNGAVDITALDFMLDMFRKAMIRGNSPAANYEWALIMTSDSQGRLTWRLRSRGLSEKKKAREGPRLSL